MQTAANERPASRLTVDQQPSSSLVIGLVNNMSAAAQAATQKQFTRLLSAACESTGIEIQFFSIDTLPTHPEDAFERLRNAQPDGLIVTGAEPQSDLITNEPIWPALARLVNWASDNTLSTVWSCLAAHAAVFQMDQISRTRLPEKLSGVFTCTKAIEHPLLLGSPSSWVMPHSRYNTLDERSLRDKGYRILTRAPRVGVDSFVKQTNASLFLLLQGHPEYGPRSLASEYRRDVLRFLRGQYADHPNIPQGMFAPDAVDKLTRIRDEACRTRNLELLAAVDAAIDHPPRHSWQPHAARLFTNWISCLAQQKAFRQQNAPQEALQRRVA